MKIVLNRITYKLLNNGKIAFCLVLICLLGTLSCKKFIEVDPPVNRLVTSNVFEDDRTANAAMLGLYSNYTGHGFSGGGTAGISFLSAMSSDELRFLNESFMVIIEFNENAVLASSQWVYDLWNFSYLDIYGCNSILEGLDKSSKITSNLKNQLKGEAKFLRAYTHFFLVNMFGKIPYVSTTDFEKNTLASRMETDEVYNLIVQDLKDSKELLSSEYSFSNGRKSRVNKYAASALLARIYLYMGKYSEAEAEATNVITSQVYSLGDLNSAFLIDNGEAIWQLESPPGINFTQDGSQFVNNQSEQTLTTGLIGSFESVDLRLQNWILQYDVDKYAPNKYKDGGTSTTSKEANTILRLAEQYLIRAEARAKENNLVGANSAVSDLNIIRNRSGLSNSSAVTQEQVLIAIETERRHELFTEGHRWFDLKRTGKVDAVMSPLKPDWAPSDKLYPIPLQETLINPNMKQNPGYN